MSQVAAGQYLIAFFTGGLLSWIWWVNARTAAHSTLPGAQHVYAAGAACGTVTGMLLAAALRGIIQ